jgi:hypothetical protein
MFAKNAVAQYIWDAYFQSDKPCHANHASHGRNFILNAETTLNKDGYNTILRKVFQ